MHFCLLILCQFPVEFSMCVCVVELLQSLSWNGKWEREKERECTRFQCMNDAG